MKEIVTKYKEIILYLIFGVLTTLVNILSYAFLTRIVILDPYSSNIIAWILSVLFAYFTNRKYVFNSNKQTVVDRIKEMISFYTYRLLSFAIDMAMMYLLIDMFNINDMISKIMVNVVVIILNYIFSKLFVFKDKKLSIDIFFMI